MGGGLVCVFSETHVMPYGQRKQQVAIELMLSPTALKLREQACRRWIGGCDRHGECVCVRRVELLKMRLDVEEDLRAYLRHCEVWDVPVELPLVLASKRFIRRANRLRKRL